MRKGQGRRPLLDACGLRPLRRHCITHWHDSVIDITKWSMEYFQKPLSANTICRAMCRCQLKPYLAKRKPHVNMVQKRRSVLWAKASSMLSAFSSTASIFDGMGVHKCIRYGQLACFGRHYECWKVYKCFGATYAPSRWHLFQQDNSKPHTAAITTAWLCIVEESVCWIGLPAVHIFHI